MKPLRAFPFPLNVGTDICQISRIYTILNGPRATRFVNRVLSSEEVVLNHHRLRPCIERRPHDGKIDVSATTTPQRDTDLWKAAAFMAGRFAAKEAAIKAHSHRRLTFHDVVVERRGGSEDRLGSGSPVARIKGEGEADESAALSISHDGDYATAVCLGHDPGDKSDG